MKAKYNIDDSWSNDSDDTEENNHPYHVGGAAHAKQQQQQQPPPQQQQPKQQPPHKQISNDVDDEEAGIGGYGSDGLLKISPHLDELMITLDDEPSEGDFDPNEHWVSCWGRFCYELSPCQNWFLVEDPPFTHRTLDIPSTFAPTGILSLASKSTSFLIVLAIFIWSMMVETNKGFFFAYLSTWNVILALIYHYLSMYNTLTGVPQPYSRVSGTVRLCWFFFVLTAHAGVLEALLYWTTEYDAQQTPKEKDYHATVGGLDFRIYMLHGGIALGVVLDGFQVNCIPLRWMHWWGCCLPLTIVYVAWTLIHAFFLWVGNPNVPDRNSIYKLIDWRFEWQMTLARVLVTILVISPLVFALLWIMSLYKWCFCFSCCGGCSKNSQGYNMNNNNNDNNHNNHIHKRERRRYLESTHNINKYRQLAKKQQYQRRHDPRHPNPSDQSIHTFINESDRNLPFASPTARSDSDLSLTPTSTRGKAHPF